jgi:hypothetical protein
MLVEARRWPCVTGDQGTVSRVSNQRVVVLTDEKRAEAFRAFWDKLCSEGDPELIINKFQVAFRAGFEAALEHTGGITDGMVERSLRVVPMSLTLGCTCPWDENGNPPTNCDCGERAAEESRSDRRRAIEAALFPGDGQ